ncbi:LysE family translocator [Pseudorhodobacter ferrugineus]|uniref:LysE family translocator n=1 Tax=Pseudorhodobacter ferrugineus TaxID=77008 RepID=UPI00040CA771|nr:LysE family translocator [Pseudorhodobacter ferrugineus]
MIDAAMFGNLLSFAMTCMVIELTPGPNMGYLAVLSATKGRRAGFAAVAGVALGLAVVGIAAALGLAAAISASPLLYEALRWGGILYLLYLAWDGWRESGAALDTSPSLHGTDAKYFTRGLGTNLLNPKAALFYVAILPGFVDAAQPVVLQTVVLSLVFVAIATGIHASVVTLAGTADRFMQNDRNRRIVGRALSLVLAAIAVWFAWSTRG